MKYVLKDNNSTSSIEWIPTLSEEVRTVSCTAINSVGVQVRSSPALLKYNYTSQEVPCVFQLLSQFPPLPPASCSVLDITHSQFQVSLTNSTDKGVVTEEIGLGDNNLGEGKTLGR